MWERSRAWDTAWQTRLPAHTAVCAGSLVCRFIPSLVPRPFHPDYCPMREPGPHLDQHLLSGNATGLDFLQLFCDKVVIEWLQTAACIYAKVKDSKRSMYTTIFISSFNQLLMRRSCASLAAFCSLLTQCIAIKKPGTEATANLWSVYFS